MRTEKSDASGKEEGSRSPAGTILDSACFPLLSPPSSASAGRRPRRLGITPGEGAPCVQTRVSAPAEKRHAAESVLQCDSRRAASVACGRVCRRIDSRTPVRASGDVCGAPLYIRLKRKREEDVPLFLCLIQPGARPSKKHHREDFSSDTKGDGIFVFRHVEEPAILPPEYSENERCRSVTGTLGKELEQSGRATGGDTAVEHVEPSTCRLTTNQSDLVKRRGREDDRFEEVSEALKQMRKYRILKTAGGNQKRAQQNSGGDREIGDPEVIVNPPDYQYLRLQDGRKIRVLDVLAEHKTREVSDDPECNTEWYKLANLDDAAQAFEDVGHSGTGGSWGHTSHAGQLMTLLANSMKLSDGPGPETVGLIEVENVDVATGQVLRGQADGALESMEVFLEEYGDIDDIDSDDADGAEVDYPEDSEDEARGRRWTDRLKTFLFSGSESEGDDELDKMDWKMFAR
ncbi:hypothetical protein CSUI_011281 [Cystoisospora suis]|uniref:Uncharacterized protein n=1 Tax=Cystoisospora suis TaxID=483139 RepID=A0A2C6KBV0_9APIC|nr:hypothetical protein CSUI_011281 [Cystoisospora suis]